VKTYNQDAVLGLTDQIHICRRGCKSGSVRNGNKCTGTSRPRRPYLPIRLPQEDHHALAAGSAAQKTIGEDVQQPAG
jgi:hypothetical protein